MLLGPVGITEEELRVVASVLSRLCEAVASSVGKQDEADLVLADRWRRLARMMAVTGVRDPDTPTSVRDPDAQSTLPSQILGRDSPATDD